MITTNKGTFLASDELIYLMSDSDALYHVKKQLLVDKTKYFRGIFSDVSSNNQDKVFESHVSNYATAMYIVYLQTGVLSLNMCNDTEFISLANRMGTDGLDNDIYQLIVVKDTEEQLNKYLSCNYEFKEVIEDMWRSRDLTGEEQRFIQMIEDINICDQLSIISVIKKNPLYATVIEYMLEWIKGHETKLH